MFQDTPRLLFIGLAVAIVSTLAGASVAVSEERTEIAYRLTTVKTMHLDDENVARQYEKTFRDLGCEAKLNGHDGHFDLAYRCSQWRKAAFADHASAHKWQDWLAALGFEVQHQH